jgi:hypothetical protein
MKPYHADTFLSNLFSEELFPVSESEYDEAMAAFASDDFDGYSEWSASVENLFVDNSGTVRHKPEPRSLGRLGGIEL